MDGREGREVLRAALAALTAPLLLPLLLLAPLLLLLAPLLLGRGAQEQRQADHGAEAGGAEHSGFCWC